MSVKNQANTNHRNVHDQKGEATVEYAITIAFLILLVLAGALLLVNPGDEGKDTGLRGAFTDVADKAAKFGTLP